jgi:hypothetical protein
MNPITILLIEDDPDDAELLQSLVRDAGGDLPVRWVTRLSQAVPILTHEPPDVALLDLNLPDGQGLATFRAVRAAAPMVPIIVLSGHDDETSALAAVREGAQDYLVKGKVGALCMLRAIRHSVERQALLREVESLRRKERLSHETRLRQLVELYDDGLLVVDRHGLVRFANPAALALLNCAEEEILGERLPIEGDVKGPSVRKLVRTDGTIVYLEVSSGRIEWGEEPARLVTLRDLTERLRQERERQGLEEQLHQAQKMEAIGHLASGVAHDFNNRLNVILGYATLAQSRAETPDLDKPLEMIVSAARQAADLTQKLLDFARKGVYENVLVDMRSVIEEVAAVLEHTVDKRVEVKCRLGGGPALVQGDRTQLQNMLFNLAVNACDAMENGGTLTFTTETVWRESQMEDPGTPEEAGEYLRIRVEDTGQGIPVEILEHVFEPFFTTKEVGKGTGLGLAVVYGTVKHHGGEITVDSTQGRGTVFRIDLPLARAGERMAAEEEDGTPVPGSGQVLVVDDEPDVAQMAADILGSLGYTVTVRTNPSEAIQHFKANAEAIDLVILDMMMPGMSGRDVFMAMQAVDPELRALVTSGYSMRGLVKETLQSGALGYIKKPFDVGAFSRKVAEVMTEASSAERQPA